MSHEPLEPPKYCFIRAPKNISTESIPSVKCLHHKKFFHEVRIYQKALENVYISSLPVVNSSREDFLPKFKYKKNHDYLSLLEELLDSRKIITKAKPVFYIFLFCEGNTLSSKNYNLSLELVSKNTSLLKIIL